MAYKLHFKTYKRKLQITLVKMHAFSSSLKAMANEKGFAGLFKDLLCGASLPSPFYLPANYMSLNEWQLVWWYGIVFSGFHAFPPSCGNHTPEHIYVWL